MTALQPIGVTKRGLPVQPPTHPAYANLEQVRAVGAEPSHLGNLARQAHPGYRAVDHEEASAMHYARHNMQAARAHEAAAAAMSKALTPVTSVSSADIVPAYDSDLAWVYEGAGAAMSPSEAGVAIQAATLGWAPQDHMDMGIAQHTLALCLNGDRQKQAVCSAAAYMHLAAAGMDPQDVLMAKSIDPKLLRPKAGVKPLQIGTTRSGKKIYNMFNHPAHAGFTTADHVDHIDAMMRHNKATGIKKGNSTMSDIYEQLVKAAGGKGEGSRGGKIVGHTKSGKPVYASSDAKYQDVHQHFKADKANEYGNNFSSTEEHMHLMHAAAKIRKVHPEFTPQDHADAFDKLKTGHDDPVATAHGVAAAVGGAYGKGPVLDYLRAARRNLVDNGKLSGGQGVRQMHQIARQIVDAHKTGKGYGANALLPKSLPSKTAKSFGAHLAMLLSQNERPAHQFTTQGKNSTMSDIYEQLVKAAGGKGEGSRGGKIIGHTSKNRPIYAHDSETYKGFNLTSSQGDRVSQSKHTEINAAKIYDHPAFESHKASDHRETAAHHRSKALDNAGTPGKERLQHHNLSLAHSAVAQYLHGLGDTEKSMTKTGPAGYKKGDSTMSDIYEQLVKAAGGKGEGSRGGRIIAHTRSGKPIYASSHASYKSVHKNGADEHKYVSEAHPTYDGTDHMDAAQEHSWVRKFQTGTPKEEASNKKAKHLEQAHKHAAYAQGVIHKLSSGNGYVMDTHRGAYDGLSAKASAPRNGKALYHTFGRSMSARDHEEAARAHNDRASETQGIVSEGHKAASGAHQYVAKHIRAKEVKEIKQREDMRSKRRNIITDDGAEKSMTKTGPAGYKKGDSTMSDIYEQLVKAAGGLVSARSLTRTALSSSRSAAVAPSLSNHLQAYHAHKAAYHAQMASSKPVAAGGIGSAGYHQSVGLDHFNAMKQMGHVEKSLAKDWSTMPDIYGQLVKAAKGLGTEALPGMKHQVLGKTTSNKTVHGVGHDSYDKVHSLVQAGRPVQALGRAVQAAHFDYSAKDHMQAAKMHQAAKTFQGSNVASGHRWAAAHIRSSAKGWTKSDPIGAEAYSVLQGYLSKAEKGEGSRGGHIIAHTKSGAPIYGTGHESYTVGKGRSLSALASAQSSDRKGVTAVMRSHKHYTEDDHQDAASAHTQHAHALEGEASRIAPPITSRQYMPYETAAQGHVGKLLAQAKEHRTLAYAHIGAAVRHSVNRMLSSGDGAKKSMASEVLEDYLSKAASKGEGSRGGHIIAHTKSGKPIYGPGHVRHELMNSNNLTKQGHYLAMTHRKYSAQDHADAAEHYGKLRDAEPIGKERNLIHKIALSHQGAEAVKQSGEVNAIRDTMKPGNTPATKDHWAAANHFNKKFSTDKQRHEIDKTWKSMSKFDPIGAEANSVLQGYLSKAEKGEGSRGGKILGHTRSGKPIYSSGSHTSAYTRKDHSDAGEAHHVQSSRHREMAFNDHADGHHLEMEAMHSKIGDRHFKQESSGVGRMSKSDQGSGIGGCGDFTSLLDVFPRGTPVDTDNAGVDAMGGSAATFMQQAQLAQFPTMWAPIIDAAQPVN